MRNERTNSSNGGRLPAASDHKDEVAFLNYRLDVVSSWPESEYRSALIQGILARLQTRAATQNPS